MHVSCMPFDRAQLPGSGDAKFVVLTPCSAIVRSRKRKIRELFAVATVEDGIPSVSLVNLDAPPTNAAESKYLDASDLSKYVSHACTPNLPSFRPRPALSALRIANLAAAEGADSTRPASHPDLASDPMPCGGLPPMARAPSARSLSSLHLPPQ